MIHIFDATSGLTTCDCCHESAPDLEDCKCAHELCDNCAGSSEPDDLDRREIEALAAVNRLARTMDAISIPF